MKEELSESVNPHSPDSIWNRKRVNKVLGQHGKVILPFAIVILLFLIGEIISPGFAEGSHIMMILKTSSFLGILALAQMIVILVGGEGLDLSVGALASAGAIIASGIMPSTNGVLTIAILILAGFILGVVNGVGIAYFRVAPLIMTLAMASVINGLIIIYSKGSALKGGAADWLKTVSGQSSLGVPHIVFIWMIIILLSLVILHKTKTGLTLYGVGSNPLTAELNGIRTKRVKLLAYGMSGAISTLAGMFLLGYIGNAFLDIGSPYVMPSVAAVVIGGVSLSGGFGNYLGVVGGSIVLTTLSGILVNLKMGDAGKQVVFGLLLLILLSLYSRHSKRS